MPEPHENLSETHIIGDDTRLTIVRAEECPALVQRHIAHVGVGDAAVPYQIVRTRLTGAYLHGCLGGEGRMLLDGRWRARARDDVACPSACAACVSRHSFAAMADLLGALHAFIAPIENRHDGAGDGTFRSGPAEPCHPGS